jgi:NAD(P)-dependent dehydrogenase (short-subunit alcohol dehydrogenase family)
MESNETFDLSGRKVFVTGGTKGIGAAIVNRLRQAGATLMTTARTLPQNRDLADFFVQADISTIEGIQSVVENVLSRIGNVDILVNNVGGSSAPNGGVLALADSDWQQALNDNLLAAVRLDRAFLPGMIERKSGVIIHVASIQRTRARVKSCGNSISASSLIYLTFICFTRRYRARQFRSLTCCRLFFLLALLGPTRRVVSPQPRCWTRFSGSAEIV